MNPSPAPPRSGRHSLELLTAGLVSLLVLLAMYSVVTERAGLFTDDTRHYAQMAQDPAYLPRLPYSFRALTPFLAGLLPWDVVTSFAVVTILGLWLSGVFLYALLSKLGLSPLACGGGLVMFLVSGLTVRALTTPLYVDALTYLTELAGFYFLLAARERLFVLTLTLGTLNRETALFLVPVYLLQLRAEGRLRRADLPRVGAVLALPLLALAMVVVLKLQAGGGIGVLAPNTRTFDQRPPSLQDLADVYSVFGAAWLLAAANVRAAPVFLRRGFFFGLLIVLQLGISRGDEGRNLSHLLPLVLPLAALELQRLARAPLPMLALVLACMASTINSRWAILPNGAVRYVLVLAGSVAALGLALWGRMTTVARETKAEAGRPSGPP